MDSMKHEYIEHNIKDIEERVLWMNKLSERNLREAKRRQAKYEVKKLDPEIGTIKCNICGYETDYEFLPFGNRSNEKCPLCKSLKRVRLLYFYLEHYTDLLKPEKKVLHTAAETGLILKLEEIYGKNYITCDLNEKRFFIKEKIDLQDIPYEDNTFDLILTSHVLEHIPDDFKTLNEFYRILKPQGMLIMLLPSLKSIENTFEHPQINTPSLRQRYYKQFDHQRYYGVDDIYSRLIMTGFKVKQEHRDIVMENNKEEIINNNLAEDPIFVGIKDE